MGNLFIIIGPPCSGREKYVESLKNENILIIENESNAKNEIIEKIVNSLNNGKNVVYNASNCRKIHRTDVIDEIKEKCKNACIHGVLFITPLEECLKNCKKENGDTEIIKMFKEQLDDNRVELIEGFDTITKVNQINGELIIDSLDVDDSFKKIIDRAEVTR